MKLASFNLILGVGLTLAIQQVISANQEKKLIEKAEHKILGNNEEADRIHKKTLEQMSPEKQNYHTEKYNEGKARKMKKFAEEKERIQTKYLLKSSSLPSSELKNAVKTKLGNKKSLQKKLKNQPKLKSKNLFKKAIKSFSKKNVRNTISSLSKNVSSKKLRLSKTKGIHPKNDKNKQKTILKIAKKITKNNKKNKSINDFSLRNNRKKRSLKSVHFLKSSTRKSKNKMNMKKIKSKKIDFVNSKKGSANLKSQKIMNKHHLKSENFIKAAIKTKKEKHQTKRNSEENIDDWGERKGLGDELLLETGLGNLTESEVLNLIENAAIEDNVIESNLEPLPSVFEGSTLIENIEPVLVTESTIFEATTQFSSDAIPPETPETVVDESFGTTLSPLSSITDALIEPSFEDSTFIEDFEPVSISDESIAIDESTTLAPEDVISPETPVPVNPEFSTTESPSMIPITAALIEPSLPIFPTASPVISENNIDTESAETVATLPSVGIFASTETSTAVDVELDAITQAPETEAPATSAPLVTNAPTTAAPTTNVPTTVAPTTAAPATAAPATAAPATAAPTTAAPATATPTTAAPATAAPTTALPTTTVPTTASSVTGSPATTPPTTAYPATAAPTTASSISGSPATTPPTTAFPATAAPTTAAPTNMLTTQGTTTTGEVISPEPRDHWPWEIMSEEPCGVPRFGREFRENRDQQFATKILDGKEALPGSFPWQVALLDEDRDLLCGGTLIAPRWVMTAAHCIRKKLFVRLFEHHINEKDGFETEQKVRRIFRHPEYNSSTIDNDIALLRLPELPAFFSSATGTSSRGVVTPACLPRSSEEHPPVGTRCMVMGWGKASVSHGWGTEVLMYTRLPVIDDKACRRANRKTITENMFCAGHYKGGTDTCSGDSGGPLLCSLDHQPGEEVYTTYGITSFGDGCGVAGQMGVYAKVNRYLDWMSDIMKRYLPMDEEATTTTTSTTTTTTPGPSQLDYLSSTTDDDDYTDGYSGDGYSFSSYEP